MPVSMTALDTGLVLRARMAEWEAHQRRTGSPNASAKRWHAEGGRDGRRTWVHRSGMVATKGKAGMKPIKDLSG